MQALGLRRACAFGYSVVTRCGLTIWRSVTREAGEAAHQRNSSTCSPGLRHRRAYSMPSASDRSDGRRRRGDDRRSPVPVLVAADDAARSSTSTQQDRDLDQPLPAEGHQLVVAHAAAATRAATRCTNSSASTFSEEPEHRHDPHVDHVRRRQEAEAGPDGPPRNSVTTIADIVIDVHELGEEEDREPDAGVLGVEAADELLLGLDEVERRVVRLGGRGDEEDRRTARTPAARTSASRTMPARPVLLRRRCRGSTACPAWISTPRIARPNAAS